jgi:hypothetical protein
MGNSTSAVGPARLPQLRPCPPAGSGVHSWIFYAACRCHECGIPPEDAVDFISGQLSREPNPWNEVADAVRSAYRTSGVDGLKRSAERKPKWPIVSQQARAMCAAKNGGLARLVSLSPAPAGIWLDGSFSVLRRLFDGDPWLCCGLSNKKFDTKRLSAWGPMLEHLRLIVPSPMTGPRGFAQAGHSSAHTLDNTGPRRFLVVEQDSGSADLQAGVLLELSKSAPLSLVVHSGNRSIHGWFFCEGQPEEDLLPWFTGAVALGADHKMWSRTQFTRIPCGIRENGQIQRVLFFNPETISSL